MDWNFGAGLSLGAGRALLGSQCWVCGETSGSLPCPFPVGSFFPPSLPVCSAQVKANIPLNSRETMVGEPLLVIRVPSVPPHRDFSSGVGTAAQEGQCPCGHPWHSCFELLDLELTAQGVPELPGIS